MQCLHRPRACRWPPHLDVLPGGRHGQALDQHAEAGLAGAEARRGRAAKAAAAAAVAPAGPLGKLHPQAAAVEVVAIAATHSVLSVAAAGKHSEPVRMAGQRAHQAALLLLAALSASPLPGPAVSSRAKPTCGACTRLGCVAGAACRRKRQGSPRIPAAPRAGRGRQVNRGWGHSERRA